MDLSKYNTSLFESWPAVKADMIVSLKNKIAAGILSPEGVLNAQALIKDLEKS